MENKFQELKEMPQGGHALLLAKNNAWPLWYACIVFVFFLNPRLLKFDWLCN